YSTQRVASCAYDGAGSKRRRPPGLQGESSRQLVSGATRMTTEVVMLTKFYDPVTREDIPCTFHEVRKGPNTLIGIADFVEPSQKTRCYVPVLVLGETRDKQSP